MSAINVIKLERSCDGCTKCCDGWLSGNAYGVKFSVGKKCQWSTKKGCSIYELRPYDPCVTFKCFWKTNSIVPEEFKPNLINTILVERIFHNYKYLDICFAGNLVSIEVLNWAIKLFEDKKIQHLRYAKDGKFRLISDDIEFIQLMTNYLGADLVG